MRCSRMWWTSVVISRAPEPPSGWPSAIAPPFGVTVFMSAPGSISQALTTVANASLTSIAPISSSRSPERASAFAVAGIGPVRMVTGSTPASAKVWNRAIGVSPSSRAFSLVITCRAAAPSEICEEFPAVTTPSSVKARLSAPRVSIVLPRRTPSSAANSCLLPSAPTTCTRAYWPANRPSSIAAAARSCEETAISSHCSRVIPHRCAIISAPMPWCTSRPSYRAIIFGPNGSPGPWVMVTNIGTRLMTSTPPATATSYCPEITPAAAKCAACWEEPHWRSSVVPGTASGQPAASTALRPTLAACSPVWLTTPQITSSTRAGSIPVRSTSAVSTWAERSTGCQSFSAPLRFPVGVRTASTITASRMVVPSAQVPSRVRRGRPAPTSGQLCGPDAYRHDDQHRRGDHPRQLDGGARPAGRCVDQGRGHGRPDRQAAEMCAVVDSRQREAEHQVDPDQHEDLPSIGADPASEHKVRREQPKDRTGRATRADVDRTEQVRRGSSAQAGQQVQRDEAHPAECGLHLHTEQVERVHVEADVHQPEVQEHRGEQAVIRTGGNRCRNHGQVVGDRRRPAAHQPGTAGDGEDEDGRVGGDQQHGHGSRPSGDLPAKRRPGRPDRPLTRAHAVRTLEADGGVAHAVRADRPVAPGAAHPSLLARMPVAGGDVGAGCHLAVRRDSHEMQPAGRRLMAGSGVPPADRDPLEHHVGLGLVTPCGRCGRDRVRDLPAADHLAEDRVLAGQPLGAADGDEELRPVGARAGIRHSQQVRAGERQVRVDLVFELVARAAGAGTEWVPALDHETRNHPVEDRPVVQPALLPAAGLGVGPLPGALGKLDEVRHRLGCLVRKELHLDVTERSRQRCDELGGQPGLLWVGGAAPRAAMSVPSSRHPRMIALPLPGQRGSESSYNASQCTRRYPCSAPAPSPTQIWIGLGAGAEHGYLRVHWLAWYEDSDPLCPGSGRASMRGWRLDGTLMAARGAAPPTQRRPGWPPSSSQR